METKDPIDENMTEYHDDGSIIGRINLVIDKELGVVILTFPNGKRGQVSIFYFGRVAEFLDGCPNCPFCGSTELDVCFSDPPPEEIEMKIECHDCETRFKLNDDNELVEVEKP